MLRISQPAPHHRAFDQIVIEEDRIVPRTVGNVARPVLAEPRGVGGRAGVARPVAAVRIGGVEQIAAGAVGLPHVMHSLPTRAVGCDEVVRDDHTLRTPADNDPAQAPPNLRQQRRTGCCCSGSSESQVVRQSAAAQAPQNKRHVRQSVAYCGAKRVKSCCMSSGFAGSEARIIRSKSS